LHESVRCTVLLDVCSTPVIEKSTDIKFGAYPEELQADGEAVGSASSRGLIMERLNNIMTSKQVDIEYQVNDFDWLREGPSPHWSWQKPVRWPFTTLTHATDLNGMYSCVTSALHGLISCLLQLVTRTGLLRSWLPRSDSHTNKPRRIMLDDPDTTNEEPGWASKITRTKYA
jgi:hypothetical protein